MGKSIEEWNSKYHEELSSQFDNLEGFENIEERLSYYDTEKQITDDLLKIKETVLEIYSSDEKVDWNLIKPLKQKLNQLSEFLTYFENAQNNKQFVKTEKIHQMRKLVTDISYLKTSDNRKLIDKYSNDGFKQIKIDTVNFFKKQVNNASNALDNIWNGNNDDLIKKIDNERNSFIQEFYNSCEQYIKRNKSIIDNLKTKEERLFFVLELLSEVIQDFIGPSKFKLLLGNKFDILDDIEEYGGLLHELFSENKDEIKLYLDQYV